jgi:hypothetical protein
MSGSSALQGLLRALAAAQLVVGIGFWTGHWFGLRTLHITLGVAFVLVLWIVAGLSLREGRARALAAFALVWGVVVAALGMAQQRLLIGDLHWTIRVLHLATAIVAMVFAGRLGQPTVRQRPTRESEQLGAA